MRFKRNKKVSFAELDNEITLFNSFNSQYVNLNDSASEIWLFLHKERTIDEIKEKLLSIYEVSESDCLKSINYFLNKLTREKLINVEH